MKFSEVCFRKQSCKFLHYLKFLLKGILALTYQNYAVDGTVIDEKMVIMSHKVMWMVCLIN